jgi:hypothetical protein
MSAEKEVAEKPKKRTRGPDKQKRKPGTGKFLQEAAKTEATSEYNEETLAFIREVTPKFKPDYNDIDEMNRRFEHYLDACAKYGKKVGNIAAYTAIGVTSDLVSIWTRADAKNVNRKQFFEYVKAVCAMYRENLMQDSKVNPVVGIFWQKNYDGLKDQKETLQVIANPLGEQKDVSALEQKYAANAALVEAPKAIDVEFIEHAAEKEKV